MVVWIRAVAPAGVCMSGVKGVKGVTGRGAGVMREEGEDCEEGLHGRGGARERGGGAEEGVMPWGGTRSGGW